MPDPRTELYNVLSRRLTEEMVARDDAWAAYWQRRRVVVVPDGSQCESESGATVWKPAIQEMIVNEAMERSRWKPTILESIGRLKAAREKDSTNRNLSTLLAVVVKVQRDLEALLNGSAPR